MSLSSKKIITPLILTSFLAVVFFSLITVMHESDGRMRVDCLFSSVGESPCPQDTLAVASHHIYAYQSFINVPAFSDVIVLSILLLVVGYAMSIFYIKPRTPQIPTLTNYSYDLLSHSLPNKKIIHWLSLLENSPSLSKQHL